MTLWSGHPRNGDLCEVGALIGVGLGGCVCEAGTTGAGGVGRVGHV